MSASQATQQFGVVRKFFHWSIALLLLIQIPLAFYMTGLDLSPEKLARYSLHKSIGMVLMVLAILRLAWAIITPRPPLPATTPFWQKALAKVSQAIMYLLVILMPVSGWMMSSFANFPVSVFGLFTLPMLAEPDKARVDDFVSMHEMQGYILMTALALHLAGVIFHQFIRRDNTLATMLPGAGRS